MNGYQNGVHSTCKNCVVTASQSCQSTNVYSWVDNKQSWTGTANWLYVQKACGLSEWGYLSENVGVWNAPHRWWVLYVEACAAMRC